MLKKKERNKDWGYFKRIQSILLISVSYNYKIEIFQLTSPFILFFFYKENDEWVKWSMHD